MITVDDFTRVNNDVNGNPRYVFHFSHLVDSYDKEGNYIDVPTRYSIALSRSRQIGGKKFHNKQYGGGIVIQSYNLHDEVKKINKIMSDLEK
jgi:hypothetical protein